MQKSLSHITLDITSEEIKIKELKKWLKYYELVGDIVSPQVVKILNGCIPSIHLYPEKMKLMFQEGGKNYIITSNEDSSIVSLIKGDMAFRRANEL